MSEKAPGWIMKILSGKDDRRAKIEGAVAKVVGGAVDWSKRYGCGHYGCAYAITEPESHPLVKNQRLPLPYVVKITRDPTEGPMQAAIGKRQAEGDYGFEAFAIVKGVFRLEPDIDWKGKKWPVYAIVREEVTPIYSVLSRFPYGSDARKDVPGIYPKVSETMAHRAIDALHEYKDLSTKWHEAADKLKNAGPRTRKWEWERKQETIESEMFTQLNKISNAFPPLGQIMQILQDEGTPLRDVHANNIGVRTHPGVVDPQDPENGLGYVICFDPGHTPSSEEIAAEEKQIVRLNPEPKTHKVFWTSVGKKTACGLKDIPTYMRDPLDRVVTLVACAKGETPTCKKCRMSPL